MGGGPEGLGFESARQPQHLEAVKRLTLPARVDEGHLVGQGQLDAHRHQMALRDRNILRLDGRGQFGQDLEALLQLGCFDEIGQRSRPAPPLKVGDIRAAGPGAEKHTVATDRHVAPRPAAGNGEMRRRGLQRLRHQTPVDADHLAGVVYPRPGFTEPPPSVAMEHPDAQLLQHPQSGVVDRGHLIGRKHLRMRQPVEDRVIADLARRRAAGCPPSAPPAPACRPGQYVTPASARRSGRRARAR
jgi:hypothetical protein